MSAVLNPAPRRRADILFTLAVMGGLYAAYEVRSVLLLIYVSALFAVVLSPAIRLIARIHIGRWRPGHGIALLILILGLASVLTLFLVFALPPIFHDARSMAADWPNRLSALTDKMRTIPFFEDIDLRNVQGYVGTAFGGAFGFFRGLAGGIAGLVTGIILTAYFIIDGEQVFNWAITLFPLDQRDRLGRTLLRAEVRLRNWLLGQSILMATIGVCSGVVFGFLHVKYYYVLATFAALANIVPVVGALSSLTLASFVAAFDSWHKLLGVLIFYAIYYQLESALLTPRIMKTTVDLPPLGVIAALLIGGAMAGILGALVAVPTAALIAVLIDEYLVQKHRTPHLHEHDIDTGLVIEKLSN
jgi:predicted PurR-regulated permease PerM